MIGLNIQTSFLTPPFGFALFYLRGVAPAVVKTLQIYKGVVPFIVLQLVALAIVGFTPPLVNYVPYRVSFTSDTAPPPRNPKLQYCLEEYVADQFARNGDAITSAIGSMKTLDISYLPAKLGKDLTRGITDAGNAMGLLDEARQADQAITDASPAFRPLHTQVRLIEKDADKLERRINALKTELSRTRGEENAAQRADLESRIAELTESLKNTNAQIPSDWKTRSKAFNELNKAELKARMLYRRTVDNAYEPVREMLDTLAANEQLAALQDQIRALPGQIEAGEASAMVEPVSELYNSVRSVEGASDIRSALSQARSALKARTPDKEKAVASASQAIELLDVQLAWRARAGTELLEPLQAYNEAIRETIGARQQPSLSRDQALYIASCSSGHRDVSLSF